MKTRKETTLLQNDEGKESQEDNSISALCAGYPISDYPISAVYAAVFLSFFSAIVL